jgi:hypothetical protein
MNTMPVQPLCLVGICLSGALAGTSLVLAQAPRPAASSALSAFDVMEKSIEELQRAKKSFRASRHWATPESSQHLVEGGDRFVDRRRRFMVVYRMYDLRVCHSLHGRDTRAPNPSLVVAFVTDESEVGATRQSPARGTVDRFPRP